MCLGTTPNFGNVILGVDVFPVQHVLYPLVLRQNEHFTALYYPCFPFSHPAWAGNGGHLFVAPSFSGYFSLSSYYQHQLKLFFNQHLAYTGSISKATNHHYINSSSVLRQCQLLVSSVKVLL